MMRLCRTMLVAAALVAAGPVLAQGMPPARVVVSEVGEREISRTTVIVGVVDFDRVADVSAEVSGRIAEVHVREGDRVAAGDPLATISTEFLAREVAITRREIERTEAELKNLENRTDRLERLSRTNATSRQDYEESLYAFEARSKAKESLQEQLALLRLKIDKSTVRAPFDGVVLARAMEAGEWATPGNPVARLAATSDVVVRVALSEDLLPLLDRQHPLRVRIDALDRDLQGSLAGVVPVAEMRSKSVPVKIAIPYGPRLVQNMSARVEVPVTAPRRLRVLSRDAVVRQQGKDFVFAVEEGKARQIPVTILARVDDLVGVDDPEIREGMAVVIDGNDRLQPDQQVTVIDSR